MCRVLRTCFNTYENDFVSVIHQKILYCEVLVAVYTLYTVSAIQPADCNGPNADDHVSNLHMKCLSSVSCTFEHRHMQSLVIITSKGKVDASFPCAYTVLTIHIVFHLNRIDTTHLVL